METRMRGRGPARIRRAGRIKAAALVLDAPHVILPWRKGATPEGGRLGVATPSRPVHKGILVRITGKSCRSDEEIE